MGYSDHVGGQPVRSLRFVALTPDGDPVPETNGDGGNHDQLNPERVELSELSTERLGRHTQRANGSDFPVRPNRDEATEGGPGHHCPECTHPNCPGVTVKQDIYHMEPKRIPREPTPQKSSYSFTRQSRKALKRRRNELEKDELELEEVEEQEDRDHQNMATNIRRQQGNDAW